MWRWEPSTMSGQTWSNELCRKIPLTGCWGVVGFLLLLLHLIRLIETAPISRWALQRQIKIATIIYTVLKACAELEQSQNQHSPFPTGLPPLGWARHRKWGHLWRAAQEFLLVNVGCKLEVVSDEPFERCDQPICSTKKKAKLLQRSRQDFPNRYAAIDKLIKFILVWFSWEIYSLIMHKIKYFWFRDFWNKLRNIFLVESQVSLSSNFDIKAWEKPCEVCSAFTTALCLYCRQQQVFTFKGKDTSLVSTPLWFSQHPPSSN